MTQNVDAVKMVDILDYKEIKSAWKKYQATNWGRQL